MDDKKQKYFLTPNSDLGTEAVRILKTRLDDMGYKAGIDYYVFPTGALSLTTDAETLERLKNSGMIKGYEIDNKMDALESIISQERA